MTFISAPYIASVSGDAEVLSQVDERIVAARQGHQLVTAFHPELSTDLSVHRYFLAMAS
jgi:5'-phosphate synthase pdxT subunit